ncbi:DUF6445 family protein [Cognatilysobacter segetis]|uniref:DUF6445 family protein n=1 Tax=Cognatilysobacter segetis TaxID=2492394 RepID=UPI00105E134D|nr:DUF6445 family protein [Lysobacter segetis]
MKPVARTLPVLPYRKPTEGRDYWIVDSVLPDPDSVRGRALSRTDWALGWPHREESWPGMRVMPGLVADELAIVEARVQALTGASRLSVGRSPDGTTLNHNCIQVVGADEGEVRPHTDSRALCRFAAVLYLNPTAPEDCGTSFFRQRLPSGQLGGNSVMPPHNNLVEALGTRFVAPGSFAHDVAIPPRYNRLLVYRANLIHSATGYFGRTLEDKRMTAVFFWMA